MWTFGLLIEIRGEKRIGHAVDAYLTFKEGTVQERLRRARHRRVDAEPMTLAILI